MLGAQQQGTGIQKRPISKGFSIDYVKLCEMIFVVKNSEKEHTCTGKKS